MPEIRFGAKSLVDIRPFRQAALRVGPGSALRLSGVTAFAVASMDPLTAVSCQLSDNLSPIQPPFPTNLILRSRSGGVSKDGLLARDMPPMLRDGPSGPPQHEGCFSVTCERCGFTAAGAKPRGRRAHRRRRLSHRGRPLLHRTYRCGSCLLQANRRDGGVAGRHCRVAPGGSPDE